VDFSPYLNKGHSYAEFLKAHATADQSRRWGALHAIVRLTPAQQVLLAGFTRKMHVVCLAGAWCGDCVNQCPIFDHFAAVTPRIDLQFFDRDTHPELAAELRICGGARVPVVVFLSEDGQEVSRYGDRTLSKYRQLVSQLAGAACPTGLVLPEQELLDSVTNDWLNEFERAQWILRTSSRLRQLHGD
jgi:thioredoxin-like negative regulator of GroEL